jgi:hypothetical protein
MPDSKSMDDKEGEPMVTLIRSTSLWAMVFLMLALGACDRPSQEGGSDEPAETPPPNTVATPRFEGDFGFGLGSYPGWLWPPHSRVGFSSALRGLDGRRPPGKGPAGR